MTGSRSEFTDYVAARRDELRRLAYACCGDWYAADDIVQVALSKLYRAWPRVRRTANEHAYARRVVLRVAIDESRRPWRRETPAPDAVATEHATAGVAAGGGGGDLELFDLLAALPPEQRKVVLLRYGLGMSVAETAETLGISGGTVKSQTSKGLAKLRPLLADLDDDRSPA